MHEIFAKCMGGETRNMPENFVRLTPPKKETSQERKREAEEEWNVIRLKGEKK